MEKNSKTKYSAISMAELGIDSVVLTPHENLEKILVEFNNEPDFIWAGGKGKKFLYESLYETLKHEDSVFTATPSITKENPKRWVNFMDDCVIFAVLHSVLTDQPIKLIHPSCFTNSDKKKLIIDTSEGIIPDYFEPTPCYQ
jgi:hypothetical protein